MSQQCFVLCARWAEKITETGCRRRAAWRTCRYLALSLTRLFLALGYSGQPAFTVSIFFSASPGPFWFCSWVSNFWLCFRAPGNIFWLLASGTGAGACHCGVFCNSLQRTRRKLARFSTKLGPLSSYRSLEEVRLLIIFCCFIISLTHLFIFGRYKDSCWAPNILTLLTLLFIFCFFSYPLAVWGITIFYITAARKKGDDLLAKYIFSEDSGI